MIGKLIRVAAVAATVGLGACNLAMDNPTAGDTKRVLGTPNDAEALISTYYKRWHSGVYGNQTDLEGMANVMSLQNYSSLANNCQNSHVSFSGASNTNAPGYTCNPEQNRLYNIEGEVDRVASNFLAKLDAGVASATDPNGITLGTSAPATDYRNLRARSFAEFERGLSLGYIALMYDSAAVISQSMGSAAADCVPDPASGICIGALRPFTEVMDSALVALQRSIDAANVAGANPLNLVPAPPLPTGNSGDGFPIPSTWLPSSTNWTAPNFIKLVRTYRARLAANVARNAAQRSNCVLASITACWAVSKNDFDPLVNWANVVADAQNGITATHDNITSTTVGPQVAWRSSYLPKNGQWSQMQPFFIGMADNSGSYASWIGTAVGGRGAGNTGFFMTTPDVRFPQGATRALQQTDFVVTTACAAAATPCTRYFENRPNADDQFTGAGFAWSNYDFARWWSWSQKGDAGNARNGSTPMFMIAELDLLQAEGLYRQGNYAGAGALVNKTRTAAMACFSNCTPPAVPVLYAVGGALPAITVFDGCSKQVSGNNNAPAACGASTPVPGGANCVPKVPVAPYNVVACGDLWEALKYEKRIETVHTAYVNWFLDNRGWGDLPQNTALFWAVPSSDLQARGRPVLALYGSGPGPGNAPNSASGVSSYGW